MPSDYRVIVFEIPDDLAKETIALDALPQGWPEEDSSRNTARRGTEWAQSMSTAVLQVPSAAIHGEFNYMLNPVHPDFANIHFDIPDAEYIDKRLRKPSPRPVPK